MHNIVEFKSHEFLKCLPFVGLSFSDADDCRSMPCQNAGTCNTLLTGGYTCDCLISYTGDNCETGTKSVCFFGPHIKTNQNEHDEFIIPRFIKRILPSNVVHPCRTVFMLNLKHIPFVFKSTMILTVSKIIIVEPTRVKTIPTLSR